MATRQINLPPGFELETIEELPVGFEIENTSTMPVGFELEDVETSFLRNTGQGIKEAAAAPVRAAESMLGGFGGLAEMAWENASIGNIVTQHIDIPGIGFVAEHLIRKYGPKKALAIADKRMTDYAEMGHKFNEFWVEQANKGWEAPNPEITEARWRDRPVSKSVSAIGAGIPSVTAAVGAAIITKSPQTGLSLLAATETGSMYHRLREQGVAPNVASKLAQMAGAWTYVTEKIPLDRLLKPHARTAVGALQQAGWEGLQEVTEGIGHNLLEYFGYDYRNPEDIPTAVKSAVNHAMDDWRSNLVGGIGIGGMSHAIMATGPDKTAIEHAKKMADELQNVEVYAPTSEEFDGIHIRTVDDLAGPEEFDVSTASHIRQEVQKLMEEGLSEEQAVNLLQDLKKEGVPLESITKPGEITDTLKEAQDRHEQSEFDPGEIHDHEVKEFGQPGAANWVTAKWRVLRNIGAEYITLPIEARFFKFRLEQMRFHAMIGKVIKSLDKQATLGDRLAGKILKRNTEPVDKLVDMLDTYEWSPDWMSEKEASQFNQLRGYTKWLLNNANIERKKAGLPLINDLKSYIPHWRNNMAELIVEKKIPQQSGFIYRLMKGLPRTIKNPTAQRRKINKQLDEHYSRNLKDLLKGIATYDLRDMYLTRPVQAAFDEIAALRKSGDMSEEVGSYITNYLRYDILQHKAPLDKAFNQTVKLPTDLINKVLKPIGREIHDPAQSVFGTIRRLMHLGALGLRIRPVTRNLGQRLLNLSLFRARDLIKAQLGREPIVEHPDTREMIRFNDLLKKQEWYQLTRGLPEDVNIESEGFLNKLLRYSMAPFRFSHVGNRYFSNVEISAKTGYYDWQYRYEKSHDVNSRYYKHIQKYSKKYDVPIEELQTQKEDMIPDIRDAIRMTQWEYMSTSMPTVMRGQVGRTAAIYQSWWMNWWFNHTAEMTNRLVTGRTKKRGDGTGGRLLSPYARLRAFKGMSTVVGLARFAEAAVGIVALSSLVLPGPTGLPPGLAFIGGIIVGITGKTEKDRKRGWKEAGRALSLVLPFKNFTKDFVRFMEGEFDLIDFMFYTEKKK